MALQPVQVEWQVGKGLHAVLESFKSVAKAQKEYERQVARGASSEDRTRKKSSVSAEHLAEKRYQAMTRTLEKEVKADERAQQRKQRALDKTERERQRLVDRSNAIIAASAKKHAADEVRAREAAEKRKLDIQRNSSLMSGRIAKKAADEEIALRNRVHGRVASTAIGSAKGVLGGVAGAAAGILAVGGGFSVADSVQQGIKNRGKATEIELMSGGEVKRDDMLKKAAEIGNTFGMSTEVVMDGFDKFFSKSGDAKAGFAGIAELVELATATGADLGELAQMAGKFHMSSSGIKETMDLARTVAGMGRKGSVDPRELAQYGGRITAAAQDFANKGSAAKALAAMAQQTAATGGADNAADATTGLMRFSKDVFQNEKKFGFNVRDKSGKYLSDPKELIKKSIVKTGGDKGKLQDLFGIESAKVVGGYADLYKRAGDGKKGKAAETAGLAAIDKAFKDFEGAALSDAQVKKEATQRIQEADKQLEMVLNQLREAVAAELLPEFVKLIPRIRELIPVFVDLLKSAVGFAEWFAQNPLTGLGALVLTKVGADLAAAGIGAAVQRAIIGLLAGAAPVSPAAAAAGTGLATTVGGAGIAAAGLAVGAGAVVGAGLGMGAVALASRQQVGGQRDATNAMLGDMNAVTDATKGPATPEALERQKKLAAKLEKDIRVQREKRDNAGPGFLTTALGQLTGQGGEMQEAQRGEQAAYGKSISGLVDQLDRLKTAIEKNEKALASHADTAATQKPGVSNPPQNQSMAFRSGTQ